MVRLTINRLLRNRYALATVITTLIILVVAILLAGVLTYFAINVVSTRVQQESLSITDASLYVPANPTIGAVEGALMIKNVGGRDVVISQIQVRGQPCSNLFYLTAASTDPGVNALLPYVAPTDTAGVYSFAATALSGTTEFPAETAGLQGPSTGDLVLPSGNTLVVYIVQPDSVGLGDIGLTIGFTVFTAQAMYYKETNVQTVTA